MQAVSGLQPNRFLQRMGDTMLGPIGLASFTTAQRDALVVTNGAVIYNSTTNDVNFYENGAWAGSGSGNGTVTSVSVTTAAGVSGSVATATTTPAITITLGAITPTSVNGLTITTTTGTLTLTSGKTLAVSNTLTLAGTDSTVMTFPSTSATIARTDAANTFTGVQTMTSPALTTPTVVTSLVGDATFALCNSVTTTLNFAGAATTLNIGASATCILNFGGSTTASEFRFLEPSGSGTNYSAFKAVAQAASITYSLPPAVGAAGTVLTDAAGDGVLTWAAAGGFSYGASVSGTTANGATITLSNSSDDAAGALKLIAGNTQANQVVLANLQIGTSGNAAGAVIQGTGGTVGGAVGTATVHLCLWADVNGSGNSLLSGGNGAAYVERVQVTASGALTLTPSAANGGIVVQAASTAASGNIIPYGFQWGDIATAHARPIFATSSDYSSFTSDTNCRTDSVAWDIVIGNTNASATKYTGARTNDFARWKHIRVHGNGTYSDNFDLFNIVRDTRKNGTGETTATGSVIKFQNLYTQTSGTLTDTVVVAKFVQNATSTGDIAQFINNATVQVKMPNLGGLVIGAAAIATDATNGFLYIPTCAGTPTGTPVTQTGTCAMVFDTTNNKLYIYDGSWLGGTTPGAFI